ncbi:MAG: nucleotidyltransferase family protein [Rectinemataceae bacterium]
MIDTDAVVRRIKAENEREEAALLGRRAQAQDLGRVLAERILCEHPEARRVWGFGSTFEIWRNYRATSDIDLAIESGDVLEIMSLVEGGEYPVDLVQLEECPPSMADFIRAQGFVLAEVGN